MANQSLDSTFQALSDPTRRAILSRLMQAPASVSELADPHDMALPSFMAHLKKLERGGLIRTEKTGRTRMCHAVPQRLAEAEDWIQHQRAIWEGRLDRLESYLEQIQKDPEP